MIDFWNFVIAVVCAIILTVFIMLIRNEERRKTLVAVICAFIIGLAFHSILLHEQARQKWKLPWDHNNDEMETD